MSKITEIICKNTTKEEYAELGSLEDLINRVAVEYAEWYAKKCLSLADEQINIHEAITRPIDLKIPEHD